MCPCLLIESLKIQLVKSCNKVVSLVNCGVAHFPVIEPKVTRKGPTNMDGVFIKRGNVDIKMGSHRGKAM